MSELGKAAEEALFWMDGARTHLTIKERMHPDGVGLYDSARDALRAALAQPEQPNKWRDAVLSALVICTALTDANRDDPERAMSDLMAWEPRDEWRPASDVPTEAAAHALGETGSPAIDGERLAFEAWMRGHCWALCATWTGDGYRADDEVAGTINANAIQTRRMWAAWRDRGALARLRDIEPPTGVTR